MDQYEATSEHNEYKDEYQEIMKFLELATLQVQNRKKFTHQTVVFLLGNTRVVKSTLFHLLQGDTLIPDEENKRRFTLYDKLKKNFMGSDGLSFTKIMNIFTKKDSGVIIIDTPGFNDTDDGYDEIISQLNMARILNKCKVENCQEILFLALAKFDEFNYNELKETFKRVYENFPEDIFPLFLQRIRFVITMSLRKDSLNMPKHMTKILSQIMTQNINKQLANMIQYFIDHPEQFFYFPKQADPNQQQQLYNNIHDFIKNASIQEEDYNKLKNAVLEHQFQMTMSDKAFVNLGKFFETIAIFYEKELSDIYDQLIDRINSIQDIEQKFRCCRSFQHIQFSHLNFANLQKFLQKLNKINKNYRLQEFCLDRIQKVEQIFKDGWIDIILQFLEQKRYFKINLSIEMENNYKKISNLLIQIGGELKVIYQKQNLNNQRLFQQMIVVTKEFTEIKGWERLNIFLGNRSSGKSTAINLLFENSVPPFISYEQIRVGNIIESINPDDIRFGQQEKDLILEFQEFSIESFPFLQYLYLTSIDSQNQFRVFLVLEENSKKQTIVFYAIQKFIQCNDFDCQKNLIIIQNQKTNKCSNQINSYLPENLIHLKENEIIRMFQKDGKIMLNECLTVKTCNQNLKVLRIIEDESMNWLKIKMKEIIVKLFQNVQLYKNQMWDQTKQIKEYYQLLDLSELNPSSNNFDEKITSQCQFFNIPISKQQSRINQLQQLHYYLIQNYNITQVIDDALTFIEQTKTQLEILSLQSSIVDEPSLRLEMKIIGKINQIFPIYFDNQIEINDEIAFLRTITYKFQERPKYNPSYTMHSCIKIKNNLKSSREQINSISLVWTLLKQVIGEYEKILRLLKFMQESQSKNFQYYECNFMKQVYHKFLSLFKKDDEFSHCQNLLKEIQKKHNKIKKYDKLENLF